MVMPSIAPTKKGSARPTIERRYPHRTHILAGISNENRKNHVPLSLTFVTVPYGERGYENV